MLKDIRSKTMYTNVVLSFIFRGLNIIISFVLVPVLIAFLTSYEYGVWISLFNIINWVNFFDIGFGNGLKNKLGKSLANDNKDLSRGYVSTTYVVLIGISLVVFILFSIISSLVDWYNLLNIDEGIIKNLNLIINLIMVSTLVNFILKLIDSILMALQRTAFSSYLYVLSQFLILVYILILKRIYVDDILLCAVLGLTLIPIAVKLVYSLFFYNGKYKFLAPNLKCFKKKYVKSLFGLGFKFFIIQMGVLVMFQTQSIILLKMFGAEHVTTYNISYKLLTIMYSLLAILMTPLWSGVIEAYAKNEMAWIKKKTKELLIIFLVLSFTSIPLLYFMSDNIFTIWLSKEFVIDNMFKISLLIYSFLLSLLNIAMHIMNGIGKVTIQLLLYVLAIIVNIPLSYYFCLKYDISGVVWASNVIFVIMNIFLWIQVYKILNSKARGVWNK